MFVFLDVGYDKDYEEYGYREYQGGYSDPYSDDNYQDGYSNDYQPRSAPARGRGMPSMVGDHFGSASYQIL